jgi:DUF1680 family protein
MALSVDMLRMTRNPVVADELELSLYNGMLGGQSPTGRWWTYDTPMDGVKKASAHDIVFQARAGSPELNCCSVNAPRGLSMLADWALMVGKDGLYLNFYGPGVITAPLPNGALLTLAQTTAYPVQGKVTIIVGLAQASAFTLHLRIPGWSQANTVAVNGETVEGVHAGEYLPLTRTWRDGDRIEVELDMTLHFWQGERESAGKVALYHGPILLAYDQRYNAFDPAELPVLDLSRLTYAAVAWQGPMPPWLLLRFDGACFDGVGGAPLLLCDFANAGMVGTEYHSWLPVAEGTKVTVASGTPQWCGQVGE